MKFCTFFSIAIALIFHLGLSRAQIRILLVAEPDQPDIVLNFTDGTDDGEAANAGVTVEVVKIDIDRENDMQQLNDTCNLLESDTPYSAIVDLSWGGWDELRVKAETAGFPYIRLEAANHQFVQASDDYLKDRDAMDAALIFETESQLDQSLYFLIGNSYIRVIVLDLEEAGVMDRLAKMRPSPSFYVAHGDTATLRKIYREASKRSLIKRDARWTFVFQDWNWNTFPVADLGVQVTFLTLGEEDCCVVMNKNDGLNCDCKSLKSPGPPFVRNAAKIIVDTLAVMNDAGETIAANVDCYGTTSINMGVRFEQTLKSEVEKSTYTVVDSKKLFTYPVSINLDARNSSSSPPIAMGTWQLSQGYIKAPGYEHSEIPRFFRIGTVPTKPWAYIKTDAEGKPLKDSSGKPMLAGYCVDMVEELSKRMYFDYELILPTDKSNDYGKRDKTTGKWSGLIGDLVNGEIDIAVAGMTMTSEREEVVDFVAPYFDQSGISIIIRKPVRPRSLFKFMEVLRVEVWLAILAALVVTALMLWFLDRFSPYSAQNNKEAHPYPCRIFTLKESFWFALTSFTPQGGGEAPKSLSGRVLVAAYWLFVVLMLATFTANLAAFLTVERMQTTVQGLEELAQQSKINYSVVKDSPYYEYFQNMASAEEDLYEKWKDLTLSSNADQARYRVWDYPIKEQYTHIFKTIKGSGLVESPEEGFKRVLEAEDGSFAFIHDASQIRYEYYNNCNFTEVGEPFAEQPYAVAVQQGSHLQEEISRVILELQKDRYFETLSSHYWNTTLRTNCPTLDDSEGITLTSLGGVFIATLVGLGIAMIVLAFEVYFHKKKDDDRSGFRPGSNKVTDLNKDKVFVPRDVSSHLSKRNVIQVGSKEIYM